VEDAQLEGRLRTKEEAMRLVREHFPHSNQDVIPNAHWRGETLRGE